MGENVELQRRLEGLTPLLAEKETKLLKLEQELEEMKGKMKDKMREMNAMKTNFEDRLRENQMQGTERERAEQRMKANLEMKNRELEGRKVREASLEVKIGRDFGHGKMGQITERIGRNEGKTGTKGGKLEERN